ncbi:minor capsid protein, partial [Striga asiatica]
VINLNEDYHVAPTNQVSHKTIKRNRGRPKNILGNTSAKTELEKITVTPTPYTNILSELLDHTVDCQLPLTELKRKRGQPKKVLGSTSTQTGVDLSDQVQPTNQKKKPGRPKKMLASTSTRSEYWDMGDANIEYMYCGVMF